MLKRLGITIALLFVFIYVLDPWMRQQDLMSYRYSAEARAYSNNIQNLSAQDLRALVKQQHQPTLVMMYASWCPYCQKQIPILESLAKTYGKHMAFVFISIDQSKTQLSDYLLKYHQPATFTAYHMAASEFAAYQSFYGSFGGNFKGGIPYMAGFNTSGEMVLEMPGMVAEAGLKQAFDALIKPPSGH